jgi:bis(5'-nucleosyl)-tetraphosphatase (symmetrical)
MPTYVIGDLQGCLDPLLQLLEHINFKPEQDTLWFTGDLVNRGPQSLETLRFVKQLGDSACTVLGNHDLHLLARSFNAHPGYKEDTLDAILNAPDKIELLEWLRQQPLIYCEDNFALVHAGLAPAWNLAQALHLSNEVEMVLQSEDAAEFFRRMYGDTPTLWQDDLAGWDRLRCITNYLTRIRFCESNGHMVLNEKNPASTTHLTPWFKLPERKNIHVKILFGHWAALEGITDTPNAYALDTGCVWGFCLTALRLEDMQKFHVDCKASLSLIT